MRPRKPLDEAIRWYRERQQLQSAKQVNTQARSEQQRGPQQEQYNLQIVEIEVKSARGLRISGQNNQYAQQRMKPFFTYEFFQFSHSSAVMTSNEPNFADRKQYEVEQTPEFLHYMRNTPFRIDFIDESVEMTQEGARDYIGSARIPLRDLLASGELIANVPIKDEHGMETGAVTVRMAIHDAQKHAQMSLEGSLSGGVMQHKRMQADIVARIARFFAERHEFEEFDMYLNMLFMKDSTNMQRVTREMFIDYILVDHRIPDIGRKDLEIFTRTHELLQQKPHFTRQELMAIFERPFREARFAAAHREAESINHSRLFNYSRVENPLATQNRESAAFGASE